MLPTRLFCHQWNLFFFFLEILCKDRKSEGTYDNTILKENNKYDKAIFLMKETTVVQTFNNYFIKSVHIRSYSNPHFPAFGLNTVQMRENADQRDNFYAVNYFWSITNSSNLFRRAKLDIMRENHDKQTIIENFLRCHKIKSCSKIVENTFLQK